MFQFRRFPSYTYGFSVWYLTVGFPIRKSPDRSSFAAPRSLSQLVTSFIGSWCQGIPLALLLAWPFRSTNIEKSKYWFSSYVELCRLISRYFCLAKIVFLPCDIFITKRHQKFPLLLPSHNCIIITMFSFQGAVKFLKETQWSFSFLELQSIS